MKSVLIRSLGLLVGALLAPAAWGGVVYRAEYTQSGDTSSITSMNNAGDVLLGGFADWSGCSHGCSALFKSGLGRQGFIDGLPNGSDQAHTGVAVEQINSEGDMIGKSFRNAIWVPTFWRDGVAHDLTDPANAGLIFVPDPGVGGTALDLADAEFVGDPVLAAYLQQRNNVGFALTNIHGQLAFELSEIHYTGVLLTRVPEPGSAMLALLALGLAARSVRRSGQ